MQSIGIFQKTSLGVLEYSSSNQIAKFENSLHIIVEEYFFCKIALCLLSVSRPSIEIKSYVID